MISQAPEWVAVTYGIVMCLLIAGLLVTTALWVRCQIRIERLEVRTRALSRILNGEG